jgi:hypothetical protein
MTADDTGERDPATYSNTTAGCPPLRNAAARSSLLDRAVILDQMSTPRSARLARPTAPTTAATFHHLIA